MWRNRIQLRHCFTPPTVFANLPTAMFQLGICKLKCGCKLISRGSWYISAFQIYSVEKSPLFLIFTMALLSLGCSLICVHWLDAFSSTLLFLCPIFLAGNRHHSAFNSMLLTVSVMGFVSSLTSLLLFVTASNDFYNIPISLNSSLQYCPIALGSIHMTARLKLSLVSSPMITLNSTIQHRVDRHFMTFSFSLCHFSPLEQISMSMGSSLLLSPASLLHLTLIQSVSL